MKSSLFLPSLKSFFLECRDVDLKIFSIKPEKSLNTRFLIVYLMNIACFGPSLVALDLIGMIYRVIYSKSKSI